MRVAICEDDNYERAELAMLIWPFQDEYSSMTVDEFGCGEDLLKVIDSGRSFDFLFIDIEMPGIRGIEVAEKIRENDSRAFIIFITKHDEYFMEAFDVKAHQYIVKPVNAKKFNKIFSRAIKEYIQRHSKYIIECRECTYITDVKDIIYLESSGNNVNIYTAQKAYRIYGSLDKEERNLCHHDFVRAHRAFLINASRVVKIERDKVWLEGGFHVPLSRRRISEVTASIARINANTH